MDEEQIGSNLGKERLKKYAKYALQSYLSGVSDVLENSQGELSTVIRQPSFYEKVKARVKRKFETDKLGGEELTLPKFCGRWLGVNSGLMLGLWTA